METIRFTKCEGKADRVAFISDEKLVAEIDNPKQGIVPHDMVHCAVERSFSLKGFVSLVFEGQSPQYMMISSQEALLVEAFVETFQACLWSGFPSLSEFQRTVENICLMRKTTAPELSEHCFQSCVELLKNLSELWNRLEVGQNLDLDFSERP